MEKKEDSDLHTATMGDFMEMEDLTSKIKTWPETKKDPPLPTKADEIEMDNLLNKMMVMLDRLNRLELYFKNVGKGKSVDDSEEDCDEDSKDSKDSKNSKEDSEDSKEDSEHLEVDLEEDSEEDG